MSAANAIELFFYFVYFSFRIQFELENVIRRQIWMKFVIFKQYRRRFGWNDYYRCAESMHDESLACTECRLKLIHSSA